MVFQLVGDPFWEVGGELFGDTGSLLFDCGKIYD
jgi:hypothetical protein